jgi:hypothetical protein
MSGDVQFNGTPEEWDALVEKSRQKKLITEIMEEDAKDGLYKKQTAVEWLIENMQKLNQHESPEEWNKLFEQAKAMEKEQIIDAATWGGLAETGEQYYNEKYGKK